MNNKDLISDVFSTLRINSNFYFNAELSGDFSIEIPTERRHIRFHIVRQGDCWLTLPNGEQENLSEGEIAIVPDGTRQILSGHAESAPTPLHDIVSGGALQNGILRYGSDGPMACILCGFFQFDEAMDHPVLLNLPKILVIRPMDLGAEPWMTATVRLMLMEANLDAQGVTGIMARLLEVIFIQTMRRLTVRDDQASNGFIAALSDPQLSKALTAMHKQPEIAWTISSLAKLAGMSRARFADRFTTVMGSPPIGYLTTWRLMKARALLANSDLDMTEIAERCGYASVPSFSSRFKKSFNTGPGAFRRRSRS